MIRTVLGPETWGTCGEKGLEAMIAKAKARMSDSLVKLRA
jgi:hypothetical protein